MPFSESDPLCKKSIRTSLKQSNGLAIHLSFSVSAEIPVFLLISIVYMTILLQFDGHYGYYRLPFHDHKNGSFRT